MTIASAGRKSATRHAVKPQVKPPRKRPLKHAPVAVGSKHGKTEDPRIEFSDDEWRDMVATAAYYRAEARGFEGDAADEDWYEAEAELRERFSAGDSGIETDSTFGGDATDIETRGE